MLRHTRCARKLTTLARGSIDVGVKARQLGLSLTHEELAQVHQRLDLNNDGHELIIIT